MTEPDYDLGSCPDPDPVPCQTPGCPDIACGETYPWACYCSGCVARLPVCEVEGCIAAATFQEFCEAVRPGSLRAWDEARLWLGECDCKSTLSWPMTDNPRYCDFMAERQAHPSRPLNWKER